MQTNNFIHIGYIKAASTSLQAFFKLSGQLHLVDRETLCRQIVFWNPFLYDAEAAQEFVAGERASASKSRQVLIVSHERLGGNPHSGHYDSKEIAGRLHDLLPDSQILICIREQMSIFSSIYKQYIRRGGVKKLRDYFMPPRYRSDPPFGWRSVPLFDWRSYEYDKLISHYYDLFGKDRCHVLLFEDLVADPQAFFNNLANIMNVHTPEDFDVSRVRYPGIPDNQVERQRIINSFISPWMSLRDPNPFQRQWIRKFVSILLILLPFLAKRYSEKYRCVDEIREMFQGKFVESNRRLALLIDRNLSESGYEV